MLFTSSCPVPSETKSLQSSGGTEFLVKFRLSEAVRRLNFEMILNLYDIVDLYGYLCAYLISLRVVTSTKNAGNVNLYTCARIIFAIVVL